ncbi:leucine-rich repeat domain-containing protein [Flavobacterium luteum]|uniref:T9SS type A sorting domain-containing protein n=1 Tax=Flavobacterium luteum TaxID=2026654 RepID=A0A7J5AF79_9FLAO|nr:T9SS type A sorting domain-containing protein [Flavobacterium luteum]KAB1156236.1 T9SS type A sorting domain-containing protein [Flavobacterium luteum]
MKYSKLSFFSALFILFSGTIIAQVVTIPDANFKAALITLGVDTNTDGQIQAGEALVPTYLNLKSKSIVNLTGIKSFSNLTTLYVDTNQLASLDVSGLTKLTTLSCNNNSLTTLTLTGLLNLTSLDFSNNQLTSFDATGLTKLSTLTCNFNKLPSLNITGLTLLSTLNCNDNLLTSLDVSGLTKLVYLYCYNNYGLNDIDASGCIALTTLYDYDPYNYNNSDPIKNLNLSGCKAISYYDSSQIKTTLVSLNLSNCTGLTSAIINANDLLTTLDVSGCTLLNSLSVANNPLLTSLDVSGLTKLNSLSCNNNALTTATFDTTGLINLTTLNFSNNQLASFDATGLTKLTTLTCNFNKLTSLNVTGLTLLSSLDCSNNLLTSINVSGLNSLSSLNCNDNLLSSINVSGLTKLVYLYCYNNDSLSDINASGCIALTTLYYYNPYAYNISDPIKKLNLSGCKAITYYDSSIIKTTLTTLDLSNCTGLISIVLNNNDLLNTLSVSGCSLLTTLSVTHNPLLTSLDVSGLSKLTSLACNDNALTTTTLKMTGLTLLSTLDFSNNLLSTFDASTFTKLTSLICNLNKLTSLNVSGLTLLSNINCDDNLLTSINVSGLTKLVYLYCYNNDSLTDINASGCLALTTLYYYNPYSYNISNPIKNLNLSGCKALTSYDSSQIKTTLISLDLSNCTALTYLTLNSNDLLTTLNVSGCSLLNTFSVTNNPLLTSLDLTGLAKITSLACNNNALTTASLKMTGLINLTTLDFSNNKLTTFDATTFTKLTTLTCNSNKLTSLNITGLSLLSSLNCVDNQLTSLNVSGLTKLVYLYCYNNPTLSDINASGCLSITTLYYYDPYSYNNSDPIKNLNISGCKAITYYDSSQIKTTLTSLDLSNCTGLTSATLNNNDLLTTLDLIGCIQLSSLSVTHNPLITSLDVSELTKLTSLTCNNNALTTLKTTGLTLLTTLDFSNNKLVTFDATGLTKLNTLTCNFNLLTSINVTGLTALENISCTDNKLTQLDFTTNSKLTYIVCNFNSITGIDLRNSLTNSVTLYATDNTSLSSICKDSGDVISGSWDNSIIPAFSPAPTGSATQTLCNSAAKVSNLVATGAAIKWYASATLGTPLAATTDLVDGTTYYASQTLNSCEGTSRLAVKATVIVTAIPTGTATQTFCNTAKISNLVVTGTAVKWYASATLGTALVSTTDLVDNSTYYASQTLNSCESQRLAVKVIVNTTPIPTGTTTQAFCNTGKIADLFVTGTAVKWYATATLGTALANTTDLVNNTTYYVSQTLNSCESASRLAVKTLINVTSVPTGTATQAFCNSGKVSDLVASGTAVKWYATPTLGTALATTTNLTDNTTYYASQTLNSCESVSRLAVKAVINITAAPTGTATQTFCNSGKIADLVATGTTIKWYDSATSGTAVTTNTALVDGTTYYASQTLNSCESVSRLAVNATIKTTAAPSGSVAQTFEIGKTIADIVIVGTNILWYASSSDAISGVNPLETTTQLINATTYYATQTLEGCSSMNSLAVTITVTLGIDSFDSSTYHYYPNPVQDNLNLSYGLKLTSIKIFNTIGQEVYFKNLNDFSFKIDMSNFKDGIYFVELKSNNTSNIIKVIKNKL